MLMMSLTAPMVQKCVRCAIAPNSMERIKAAQRTWVVRVSSWEVSIP